MIPKIVHYCWFGKGEMDEVSKKCIDSWKKYLVGYEFKLWNEDNFNVNETEYTKQAYQEQQWAFVSDYVRCKVLYEYGGIYMDTDVEVFKSLDEFIHLPYVFKYRYTLPFDDAFFMVEKGNVILKKVLEHMSKSKFTNYSLFFALLLRYGKKQSEVCMINKINDFINDNKIYTFSNEMFNLYIKHYENNSWK